MRKILLNATCTGLALGLSTGLTGDRLHAKPPSAEPTVAGRLIGPDLEPAAGLEVQLIPVPGSHARRLRELGVAGAVPIIDHARSDAEGRFELVASRAGPNSLAPVQLPKMHRHDSSGPVLVESSH